MLFLKFLNFVFQLVDNGFGLLELLLVFEDLFIVLLNTLNEILVVLHQFVLMLLLLDLV